MARRLGWPGSGRAGTSQPAGRVLPVSATVVTFRGRLNYSVRGADDPVCVVLV